MSQRTLSSSPAVRVAILMACMFGLNGVSMPFIPKFLEEERGLTGIQIAAVMSAFQLTRIVFGPPIAAWGDGFADRRSALRWLACGAVLGFLGLLFAQGFPALLVAGFCAYALAGSMTPLAEAAAMRAARSGDVSFGITRGIGSTAYVLANLVGGVMVSRFGSTSAAIYCACAALATLVATLIGLKPSPAEAGPSRNFFGRLRAALALCRRPRFALALTATGLIQAAHGFYYAFGTLAWTAQGIDPALIGVLWAIGVIAEIVLFACLRSVERLAAPEALVLIGGLGALVRWTSLAFSPPLALLIPLQVLHALTFTATHIGALRIVERETPPELSGSGMTLYAMLAAGTLLGLSTLASGVLFDRFGALGYLAMTGLAAVGLLAALAMLFAPHGPARHALDAAPKPPPAP